VKHSALVTLAIGKEHRRNWERYCRKNWQAYAARYGYDLLCLTEPLDTSSRAQKRENGWQTLLVLSQPFARAYERIIVLDRNTLINVQNAPSVVEGIPLERIGTSCADLSSESSQSAWQAVGQAAECNVLVLSPERHRDLLEQIYERSDMPTASWQVGKSSLAKTLQKANCVQWLDRRFNYVWQADKQQFYDFFFTPERPTRLRAALKRRVARFFELDATTPSQRACATTAWLNSYFLHIRDTNDLKLVQVETAHWRALGLLPPRLFLRPSSLRYKTLNSENL